MNSSILNPIFMILYQPLCVYLLSTATFEKWVSNPPICVNTKRKPQRRKQNHHLKIRPKLYGPANSRGKEITSCFIPKIKYFPRNAPR